VKTAVVTPVHGRHEHLSRQQDALAGLLDPSDLRVVVAMDDPAIAPLLVDSAASVDAILVDLERGAAGLPIAAARNAGAAAALDRGADLLVFLDVDCLPAPQLVRRYVAAAADPAAARSLLCGPVAYLPPPPPGGYDLARLADAPVHGARPAPPDGELETGGDPRLFWSLSFAVTAPVWRELGGFYEGYQGYGAEDTDFAMVAAAAGVGLTWVGGATAYHQWHPTSLPPVQHLDDILRNGAVFAERWGWWPMEGWFTEFAGMGLVQNDGRGWTRCI
jgi:GT2 family glycosyltransferase